MSSVTMPPPLPPELRRKQKPAYTIASVPPAPSDTVVATVTAPTIPSPWDALARRLGKPREQLDAFRNVYPYIYYENPNEPGLKFCRLRDITGGRVSLSPELKFHVKHSYDFWLRDARMRDPLEILWQGFWKEVLNRPSLEELVFGSYKPKWISPDEFMKTDGYVPLRWQAPVYCGINPLGTCIAKYARVLWCNVNASVTLPLPFLAVTPIDAIGDGPAVQKEYFGAWWDVPMSMCIPLRLAVLQWPTANSSQPPDQVLLMREDGLSEFVNINYFMSDERDPAIVVARLAFNATYPSAAATTSIPIVPNGPDRVRAMKPYSVVRYEPEYGKNEADEQDQALPSQQVDDDEPETEEATDARLRQQATEKGASPKQFVPVTAKTKDQFVRLSISDLYPI